ncbi:MAG: hypothetical protein WCH61_11030 [bacterium]
MMVMFEDPPVKLTVLGSNVPLMICVYVTVLGASPLAVIVRLPSTVVQPLTFKLTLKLPPFALRSRALVVIEPDADELPSLTAPPAWKSFETDRKFVFPVHALFDPVVDVLFPVMIEAKSSLSREVLPPPPPEVIVMLSVAFPVPAEFVAEMVAFEVPATVGVPEMSPVDVFTVSPDGRPAAAKDAGELEALIW